MDVVVFAAEWEEYSEVSAKKKYVIMCALCQIVKVYRNEQWSEN